jgi:hypothetical protein
VTITASTVISVPIQSEIVILVKQRDVNHTDDRDERNHAGTRKSRPDVARVLREADVTGSDLERTTEHELPDEKERHQSPEPLASECFAQVVERSA